MLTQNIQSHRSIYAVCAMQYPLSVENELSVLDYGSVNRTMLGQPLSAPVLHEGLQGILVMITNITFLPNYKLVAKLLKISSVVPGFLY